MRKTQKELASLHAASLALTPAAPPCAQAEVAQREKKRQEFLKHVDKTLEEAEESLELIKRAVFFKQLFEGLFVVLLLWWLVTHFHLFGL